MVNLVKITELVDKAKQKLEVAKLSPRKRAAYERGTKHLHSEASWAHTQLKKEQDLIKKGKLESNIEFAKIMKAANEPIEKIIEYTGLTKEQIENI